MKPYTLFLLSLFLACRIYAQAPIAFERYYDFGLGNAEEGTCVQQTNDGGYIITGRQTVNLQTMYILLQKTDSLGNVEWMKQIGSQYMNKAYAVRQTNDNGYILAGFTDDASGTDFVCLVKTDSIGDTLWSRNYAPTAVYNYRQGVDVILTPDSGFLVLAAYVDQSDTMWQSMLIKTNSIGDTLWTKKYINQNGNTPCNVKTTNDGGYIITSITNPSSNDNNFYLVKTDSLGDTIWTKTILHPNGMTYGSRVTTCTQQANDNGYILAGTVSLLIDLTQADVILIKTDQFGDTLWTKTIGGVDADGATGGVLQTTDGGYAIAAYTRSWGSGGTDVYLVKTNSVGIVQWTKTFGGSLDDDADYIIQTSDGGFAISGMTMNWGDGGSVYFVKTDSLGNAPTGIAFINDKMDLQIYPNPSNGVFNIRGSKTNVQKIEAFNQLGEKIYESVPENFQDIIPVDISENPSGIYLLVIHDTNGTTLTKKIIINH